MDLITYIAVTRYMVVTDFGKYGVQGLTYDDFDTACDNYASQKADGCDGSVYVINFGPGTNTNITAEAVAQIAKRCNERALDLPAWVYAALPSHIGGVAA